MPPSGNTVSRLKKTRYWISPGKIPVSRLWTEEFAPLKVRLEVPPLGQVLTTLIKRASVHRMRTNGNGYALFFILLRERDQRAASTVLELPSDPTKITTLSPRTISNFNLTLSLCDYVYIYSHIFSNCLLKLYAKVSYNKCIVTSIIYTNYILGNSTEYECKYSTDVNKICTASRVVDIPIFHRTGAKGLRRWISLDVARTCRLLRRIS